MTTLDTTAAIGDRFGVTEYSVIHSRKRVFTALMSVMGQIIKWPDEDEYEDIAQAFEDHGFPDTIGALDGSHIRIKAPKEEPQDYVNRKKFHSIVLQAICREDMRFTNIFTGYPGSVHDARVFRNSPIFRDGPRLCGDYHVIADKGYPVKNWCMVAFRDNGQLTPDERRFNSKLSASRQVIERAFGVLKGRMKRLQFVDVQSLETLNELIVIACIMHNICIMNNDHLPDYYDEPHPDADIRDNLAYVAVGNDNEGIAKRDRIMGNL